MVYTWIADISALLNKQTYKYYYSLAPDFRKEKADRIRFQKGKAQSIGVWILWERMKKYYGLGEETDFNLSHSGSCVLCSASDQPDVKVGCDIEVMKDGRLNVARRFYCPQEFAYIKKQKTEAGKTEAFYRYWVLKESFMKVTKKGMGLDTKAFEIHFDGEDRPAFVRKPEEFPEDYFYQEYAVDFVNAKVAVCATENSFSEIRVEKLKEIAD